LRRSATSRSGGSAAKRALHAIAVQCDFATAALNAAVHTCGNRQIRQNNSVTGL
jgi:hypothetical protein